MTPAQIDILITNGGMVFVGVWVTLLGLRLVGHKPGKNLAVDAWFQRWGWIPKIIGPILILTNLWFGIYRWDG